MTRSPTGPRRPIEPIDSGFNLARSSSLDTPHKLTDLLTGLPAMTALFNDFRPLAEESGGTTILYVHLPANHIIEERYGWEALEAYNGLVANFLRRLSRDMQREREHCVCVRAFADDYVLLLPQRDRDEEIPTWLADGMRRHVQAIDDDLATLHEVYVGVARIKPFARIHPERLLYRGIQRAQTEATDVGRQRVSVQTRVLDRCIDRRNFTMVYQPLVRLPDHAIFAYEALVRCGQQELRNPHVLFNVAEQGGRIWPLSRLLREMAIEPIDALPHPVLMFVNLHPQDFTDPELIRPEEFVRQHAERLVFEVTERATINDFDLFRQHIAKLRAHGVRIAVDDLGSGYAALNSVAELAPDYIKFDMTLIRAIDASPIRQNLLRSMIAFAHDTGAKVIAEGVETEAELRTLRDLGCHFVQGFYLARPSPPFIQHITPP